MAWRTPQLAGRRSKAKAGDHPGAERVLVGVGSVRGRDCASIAASI